MSKATIGLLLVLALTLLASCGNGEDEAETPTPVSLVTPISPTPAPSPPPPPAAQTLLPCYMDSAAASSAASTATPTPTVIRIQLLDRPYRMIPSNIVLTLNRSYRFIVSAESTWQAFRIKDMPPGIYFDVPPASEVAFDLHTTRAGVFVVENWRRVYESRFLNSITVLPAGASSRTWHPAACGTLSVRAPALGARLTTPFVVQGSFEEPYGSTLHIDRLEAWYNDQLVGAATVENFTYRGSQTAFHLTVRNLPPGSHSLLLQALLQNGTIAATTTLPVTIQHDQEPRARPAGYRGSFDRPAAGETHTLPLTVEGWVVIPGSARGTGVGTVEVWNGPRETGQFLANAVYGAYRPDVAQALGEPRYAASGFFAHLNDLPPGPATLHVYVRDRQTGSYVPPLRSEPPLTRRISLAEGKLTNAAWPVALAPAPDNRLFFAELLTGNIRVVQDGVLLPNPFATLEDVSNHAESGLLGLALHPDFPRRSYVYAMYVVDNPETGLPSGQRVVRFRDVNNVGQDYTVVLDGLPATKGSFHNGGRIAFGPDGKLYISIGDTHVPELAQDTTDLAGSILRYNPDGSVPDDNPIAGSPIFAYGLRNVFGLAFQPDTGFLYATDNGPGGFDEVNKIEAGQNYGWPTHMGVAKAEGFTDPIANFGIWPYPPIGPTGVAFSSEQPDLLLFCAYHDFYLRALRLSGPGFTSVESTAIISKNCALDVAYGTDGWLYYSTVSAIYRARLDDLLRLHEQNNP